MNENERREMLCRLAERIMGWKTRISSREKLLADMPDGGAVRLDGRGVSGLPVWSPLESIADAWMLVDALRAKGWRLSCLDQGGANAECSASFVNRGGTVRIEISADAETAPLAICLAADEIARKAAPGVNWSDEE